MKQSDTDTIIAALDILARDIHSEDGTANAAIAEGAQRLRELAAEVEAARAQCAAVGRRQLRSRP